MIAGSTAAELVAAATTVISRFVSIEAIVNGGRPSASYSGKIKEES
jgi:hypothetical protein